MEGYDPMNPSDVQAFTQAVNLAQFGQTDQAHFTLNQLYQKYPHDCNLLFWLAFTSAKPEMARQYLEQVRRLEPNNTNLVQAQTWLTQSAQAVSPSPAWENVSSSPYQPDYFPQVPVQTRKPQSKKTRLILLGIAVIALIFVATIVFLTFTAVSDVGEIPAPVNSRRLNLESRNEMLDLMKNFGVEGIGMYATSNQPGELKVFYEAKMREKGWQLAGNNQLQLSPSGIAQLGGSINLTFQKEKKFASISIVGPLNSQTIQVLADSEGDYLRNQVKPGDTIVVLVQTNIGNLLK